MLNRIATWWRSGRDFAGYGSAISALPPALEPTEDPAYIRRFFAGSSPRTLRIVRDTLSEMISETGWYPQLHH